MRYYALALVWLTFALFGIERFDEACFRPPMPYSEARAAIVAIGGGPIFWGASLLVKNHCTLAGSP